MRRVTDTMPRRQQSASNARRAQNEQQKQSFQTALCEIDELKQTLRHSEVQLTKSTEETLKFKQLWQQEIKLREVSCW